MTQTFADLGLTSKTLDALDKKGFVTPSPIQAQTIPLLLANKKNIIGQAATGTGKTAAFGIPLIEMLNPGKHIQALILVPTRELAIQVTEEINSYQSKKDLKIITIYGGQSYDIQNRLLKNGVDILVGTPGRVIDHMNKGNIKLENLSYFILDEADEMLNMGFVEDIDKIFATTSKEKRVLLFSATMPRGILSIVKKYMGEHDLISVKREDNTTSQTEQSYIKVTERDKLEVLCRVMNHEQDFYGIIFCKTRADVDVLSVSLIEKGYNVRGLHGDVQQKERINVLKLFKDKKIKILIATDVAARGIDVNDLTHVINYGLPQNSEAYIHRIGRTGRAGKTGIAITFLTHSEGRRFGFIQRVVKGEIKERAVPEIKDIIKNKQAKLKDTIKTNISEGNFEKYIDFTKELLGEHTPEEIISTLLKMSHQAHLDEDSYQQIQKGGTSAKSGTRLFVAIGKNSGFGAREFIEHIEKESGVKGNEINDLYMMEEFSFITVSDTHGETILRAFANQTQNGKPLVTRAKVNTSPSGDRPRFGGGDRSARFGGGAGRSDRSPRYGAERGGSGSRFGSDKPRFGAGSRFAGNGGRSSERTKTGTSGRISDSRPMSDRPAKKTIDLSTRTKRY